jgi:SET domain-containing protein
MATETPTSRLYVVRNSPIHGRGVFAGRDIAKRTRIIEYRGKRIDWEEAQTLPDSDPGNPFHTFFFSLDDGRVIDAGQRGNAARWINHSCDPNCKTEEDEDGRIFILAKRDIAAGEELAYDYRLRIDGKVTKKDRKAYACRCGAADCRGAMLDAKLLKKGRKKKKKK